MATKKNLIDRAEYIKSLIESKGHNFNYSLPKNFKKEHIFKLLDEMDSFYKSIK